MQPRPVWSWVLISLLVLGVCAFAGLCISL